MLWLSRLVSRLKRCSVAGCLTEFGLLFRWLQATPLSWSFCFQQTRGGQVFLHKQQIMVKPHTSRRSLPSQLHRPYRTLHQLGQTWLASLRTRLESQDVPTR